MACMACMALSVWLLLHFFIHSHGVQLGNLAVTPVLAAGAVALLGWSGGVFPGEGPGGLARPVPAAPGH